MKNLTKFMALAMLVSFASCDDDNSEKDKGMEMGNLYVSNSKPQPGDEIVIRYSGENPQNTEATVNYLVGEHYYPADIDLKDSADAYFGKISIPDTVHALAFNFEKDDRYDSNNKKGYVISLYDDEGKELKGAQASRGIYYSGPASNFDIKIEKDSAVALVENDFKENPDLTEKFDSQYSRTLLAVDQEKAKSYIDQRIEYYNKKDSLSLENYSALAELYSLKKEKEKSDSITQVAVRAYPRSEMAKRDLMMKVVQSPEIDEKIKHFETYNDQIGTDGYEKNIMLRYIANAYAEEEDWENFEKYASAISADNDRARVYNSAAWQMAEKEENLDFAEKISKKAVDLVNNIDPKGKNKPDFYSARQFEHSLKYAKSMYHDTYAYVKYKQGDLEEAVKIQADAISDVSDADTNTRYVQYLTENKNYEKAKEEATSFMKENRASGDMENYLKTAYSKTDNEQDFETYLAEINEEAKNNAMAELEENMLNEEAPAFTLKDLEGNEIALNSLKGKTVILDFWATWCGPCKQSFPGMQKAVEKYADNDKVEFFFVNTWENGDDRKKMVSDFIEKNDYDFHVIMDEPVAEGSREFTTTSDFEIRGIPTKIIIGPEGKINFKAVGYDGNNEKLLQEIGLMIDLTQKNSKPEA